MVVKRLQSPAVSGGSAGLVPVRGDHGRSCLLRCARGGGGPACQHRGLINNNNDDIINLSHEIPLKELRVLTAADAAAARCVAALVLCSGASESSTAPCTKLPKSEARTVLPNGFIHLFSCHTIAAGFLGSSSCSLSPPLWLSSPSSSPSSSSSSSRPSPSLPLRPAAPVGTISDSSPSPRA